MTDKELKVTELMIGDWIIFHESSKVSRKCTVRSIDNDSNLIVEWVDDGDIYSELTHDISPMPLTPEILEKNGWIKTKYAYGRDCMEIHGADELPEGVDNALSMARWSIDKNYQYHFLDLYMWKGSVMQHNVHYVHQLQHAFRIFGIEKEIIL